MGKCIKPPAFEWEWQRDQWILEHPDWKEELREYDRDYARTHREARNRSMQTWREKNPEKARQANREAQKRHYYRVKALREAERKAIAQEEENQRKREEAEAKAIAEYEASMNNDNCHVSTE